MRSRSGTEDRGRGRSRQRRVGDARRDLGAARGAAPAAGRPRAGPGGRGKLRGRRVRLVGIGTSWHAAQQGAWLLAEAGVDARAEHAADLAPYGRGFADGEAVIVLSHTGSTGYSAEMLRRARETGGPAVGISAIGASGDVETVEPERLVRLHGEPHGGVAAPRPDRDGARRRARRPGRGARPRRGRPRAACADRRRAPAPAGAHRRGPNGWTAQEGALKVREASYVAAEGPSAEQFFHGPSVALDGVTRWRCSTAAGRWPSGRAIAAAVEVGGAQVEVRRARPGRTLSIFALTAVVQCIALDLAEARGTNPDRFRYDEDPGASGRSSRSGSERFHRPGGVGRSRWPRRERRSSSDVVPIRPVRSRAGDARATRRRRLPSDGRLEADRDDGGVASRAVTLLYDEVGVGPPLVLQHAGVADRSMWSDVLPLPGFRAITPDLPGFGEAAVRPGPQDPGGRAGAGPRAVRARDLVRRRGGVAGGVWLRRRERARCCWSRPRAAGPVPVRGAVGRLGPRRRRWRRTSTRPRWRWPRQGRRRCAAGDRRCSGWRLSCSRARPRRRPTCSTQASWRSTCGRRIRPAGLPRGLVGHALRARGADARRRAPGADGGPGGVPLAAAAVPGVIVIIGAGVCGRHGRRAGSRPGRRPTSPPTRGDREGLREAEADDGGLDQHERSLMAPRLGA